MNKLTNSIFRSLYQDNFDKNFVFSPASYLEAIHNLSLCLKGENLRELLDSLEVSESELVTYIREYKSNLNFESYNVLLYSNEYWAALNQEVLQLIAEVGGNIESFTNPDELVTRINKKVVEKTHGKIDNLVSKRDFTEFTKFIILNCVYFKKEWLYEFNDNKNYIDEPFYGVGGVSQIRFLRNLKRYNFYEDNDLDIVELPYLRSDICCYLFVPSKNKTVFDLINNLEETYNKINSVKWNYNYHNVHLTVPPFKIESTFDLEKGTKLAGVNKIWEWNKDWSLVNFDKLLPEASLKVEKIIQKVYIDFTRKGTEAAAATVIFMNISGCIISLNPPIIKYVRADNPFIYVLANSKKKDNPLFMGVVNKV